ncbi:MAG: DegV family protein [Actinomycetota bacterium]
MTVAVVVDSNAQLAPELAERHSISVVPLPITVDGVEYLEGVDLDVDDFYEFWADAAQPHVTTSQPSPAAFVDTYDALAADGATAIVSVHVAGAMSGTINSARLAAERVGVPVHVVDSGTASFGISCCAWAAADALASGAPISEAVDAAVTIGRTLRTSFVAGVPALVERSGRAEGVDVGGAAVEGIPVLAMSAGDLMVLATVDDLDAAVVSMVDDALAWPASSPVGRRIAIGTSDASSRPLADGLLERLRGAAGVADVIEYRIGPSVGAHTGPGTAGLFVF